MTAIDYVKIRSNLESEWVNVAESYCKARDSLMITNLSPPVLQQLPRIIFGNYPALLESNPRNKGAADPANFN